MTTPIQIKYYSNDKGIYRCEIDFDTIGSAYSNDETNYSKTNLNFLRKLRQRLNTIIGDN